MYNKGLINRESISVRRILFLAMIVLIGAGCILAQSSPQMEQVLSVIKQVKQEMAPDRRLEVFSITPLFRDETLFLQGETTVPAARDTLIGRISRLGHWQLVKEITTLPDSSVGNRALGLITISTGHLRRGPDVDYEMISQGILGEAVTILKKEHDFYLIKLSDGYLGYMMGSSICRMTNEEYQAWKGRPKAVFFRENFGEIFSEKNSDSFPVSDFVRGATVALVKKEGKWQQVELPDGRRGYVKKSMLIDDTKFSSQPKPKPGQLVKTAREFTGHPYLWGGLSTKGFDCSGFTKTIYRLHGIELPRDANMQVKMGKVIPFDSTFSSVQPGDLLFFGRTMDRITHVGMYIGDRRFIHSDGMVHINSFDPRHVDYNPYRFKSLRAVRRII
jgi:gamma-D-glutamyl-L-lysine dipeptidyl-peptidase